MSNTRLIPQRHGAQDRADLNLVVPQAHKASAMRVRETASTRNLERSRAVARVIGEYLRPSDVDSTMGRSTPPTTPGTRTSRTATSTTTTRPTRGWPGPSANSTSRHAAFCFVDLVQAYYDCRQNKRNTNSAREFEIHLELNLGALFDELVSGEYRPGRTICFVIERPKPREVWAADFRDRIVHHLLCNAIAPRFQAGFIADSCACIPGRGTLYAAERLAAKIDTIAGFKADDDYRKLRQLPGDFSDETLRRYRDRRKGSHTKKLLAEAERIMEKALREIGGAA